MKNKLLFVDDDQTICQIFQDLIDDEFCVMTESDPDKALDLIGLMDFDLIITDLIMPHLTGAELIAASKHLKPFIPVFAVTGYGKEMPEVKKAMQAGACGLFEKPFLDPDVLKDFIRHAIANP